MKMKWTQRGLALIMILALVIPVAMAEDAADAPILAEGDEVVTELEELDLYDPSIYADEVDALEVEPEATEVPTPEPSPEATEVPAVEPSPEATEVPAVEPSPEATEVPAVEPSPEATEVPASEPTPEAVPAVTLTPEASAAPEAEVSEAIEVFAAAAAAPALAFPKAKLTLGKGEKTAFAAVLTGAEAQVTYASSKPSVVKVDAKGNLRARKKGTAKITATANGLKAVCTVKVVKAPSKVKLSKKKATIGLEETLALKAKLSKGSASVITWTSGNPAVATVDAAGNVKGVAAGTAKIVGRTFNGKKAACTVTVLNGRRPTSLTFPAATLSMAPGQTLQLTPQLGEGEAALFTYSSSKKKVASVSAGGLVTAKKNGAAKITVKTHTGLKCALTVKVVKAPSKVTLSKSGISLEVGKTATLKATLPSGTTSEITWTSSSPEVATVDAKGLVQALTPGTTTVTAATFNGKTASCAVTVTEVSPDNVPPALTNAQMVANLSGSSSLGSKRAAIGKVAALLLDAGYEPAFVAGVCANVYSEGTYGFLESSKYVTNYLKRPKYFCYLDGGDYYTLKDGKYVLTAMYLSEEEMKTYTGPAEARLRYGEEKYYWNKWSGKKVQNLNLIELQAFIDDLTAGKWQGKFGMGITQWTGGRTRKLMAMYRKHAGQGSATITEDQVIAAENEMILYDLQGDYKKVYTGWKSANSSALHCPEAARSAGSTVCLKYEIPANKEQSAVKRGDRAATFYEIMIGTK